MITRKFASICLCLTILATTAGVAQSTSSRQEIILLSDTQAPMAVEKLFLKPWRNEEARDSLFADIIRRKPSNLLLLGDITAAGSSEKRWLPVDSFAKSLRGEGSEVFAIPGNHEYMFSAARGIRMFERRFRPEWVHGYTVTLDSMAFVMLNSNFARLGSAGSASQLKWYRSVMDSLDADKGTLAIIICIHHAPFSNSKIVGSSEQVAELIVPRFNQSAKAKLMISGHSHNLEYFTGNPDKHFLVIGGGGGIAQPLEPSDKRRYKDQLIQDEKPLYFYLDMERTGNHLNIKTRGFKTDFRFFELEIGTIKINKNEIRYHSQ